MTRQQMSWRRAATVFVSGCVLMLGLVGLGEAQAASKLKDCPAVPNWGVKLPGDKRFVPVFQELVGGFLNVPAYCDRETGLVWDRAPVSRGWTWDAAVGHCAGREIAGRMGWHLPLLEQLASLIDPNSSSALPPGHPFTATSDTEFFWSATALPRAPSAAYIVAIPPSGDGVSINVKSFTHAAWCVRGGQTFDGNTHQTPH